MALAFFGGGGGAFTTIQLRALREAQPVLYGGTTDIPPGPTLPTGGTFTVDDSLIIKLKEPFIQKPPTDLLVNDEPPPLPPQDPSIQPPAPALPPKEGPGTTELCPTCVKDTRPNGGFRGTIEVRRPVNGAVSARPVNGTAQPGDGFAATVRSLPWWAVALILVGVAGVARG